MPETATITSAPAIELAPRLPPLMPGAWRQLTGQEAQQAYVRLLAALPPESLELLRDVRDIRVLPLSFYDQTELIEVNAVEDEGIPIQLHAISAPRGIRLLTGKAAILHGHNQEAPIHLTTPDQAQDYLRFFCGAVHGGDGPFHLVEKAEDLWWSSTPASLVPGMPIRVAADQEGGWRIKGTVNYGDALFGATFQIKPNGQVAMVDDQPLKAGLPVRRVVQTNLTRREACPSGTCGKPALVQENRETPAWQDAQARLRQYLAGVGVADTSVAARHFGAIVTLVQDVLGENAPESIEAHTRHAQILEQAGDDDGALKAYSDALALREKNYGPEHPGNIAILTRIGKLHQARHHYQEAEPHLRKALAISDINGPDHIGMVEQVNSLATLYEAMGQYARAEPLYARALAITEKAQGPEHPETGTSLNNLALLYKSMGQYARVEPLYVRALAIAEKAQGPEHPSTGTRLNNLAGLYQDMGQYARAEPLYVRALAIAEKTQGPEHPSTGTYLNNLAVLYQAMGQYARAEPLFVRALAIGEKVLDPEHPDTGAWLNNLAGLYESMGQYARAEPLYQRALAIAEKAQGPEHPDTGTSLNSLAELYRAMGQYARAEPLYVRALEIAEKFQGLEHPDTGTRLHNLAALYRAMGQYARAEPLYQRALAIFEKALGPEHPWTGVPLNHLAELYRAMGQYARAEPLYQRALVIIEESLGPEHPWTGFSLQRLARLHIDMGQYARAEPLLVRALLIAQHAGDPQLLRHVQENLSSLLDKQSNPEAAIFFGKQAVNTLQGLRANVANLGKDTLKDFDSSIEGTYRDLSRLLIAQGRLIEAERVLELLKEQEQFQYVRRDASVADLTGKAPLTAFETTQAQALDTASAPLAPLHAELKALRSKPQLTPDESARLAALRQQIDAASQTFQQALTQVIATLGATRQDKIDDLKEAQGLQNTLRDLSKLTGDKVVLLYTVTDKESYSLILTTADYRRAYTVPVGAQALNEKIAAWRATLKNPRLDPRPQAKALLDIVLPPEARAELAQLKAGSLMWHLDGALRLLPLAALHDGERYLIERYRLATYTTASRDRLKDSPKAQWQGLGLGVSEARQVGDKHFAALSAVPEELATVIRQGQGSTPETGVIPGQRYLNPDFNWDSLQGNLKRKGKYPLVHIASHFSLEPGNDTMSYLLPGAGEPITLALLTRQDNLFGGVDLLTLSACETGVGGGRGSDGVEVDGLSFIAQRQGAKAVLASLWPVADASTAKLMQRFYQLRQDNKLTKAEALRQAQMEFIRSGKTPDEQAAAKPPSEPDTSRAAGNIRIGGKPVADTPAVDLGWAHPYYWAPFVLMGNWL